jgi:hypothetical protein
MFEGWLVVILPVIEMIGWRRVLVGLCFAIKTGIVGTASKNGRRLFIF